MKTNKILELIQSTGKGDYPLEKELGLAQGSIKNWKNNKSKPSAEALQKIADYFSVSVDFLLGRTDFPQMAISSAPNVDYSFLFIENSYLSLASLAQAIDFLNEAKKTAITDNGIATLEGYITNSVRYLVDLLTVSTGEVRSPEYVDLILKGGSKGFEELAEKLSVNSESLDRLYKRNRSYKQ